MDFQNFSMLDLAHERDARRMAQYGPNRPTHAASDYELAAATVYPPLGSGGDWRDRLVRVLDRRMQAGLVGR